MQRLEFDLHVLAQLLVQGPQGFVHRHQLRVKHQRAGQCHTLLLAARELGWVAHAHLMELHHVKRARHFGLALGRRHLAHFQRVGDVASHGHVGEQGVVLEHHAEVALVRRGAGDGYAAQADLTGGRGLKPRQHHQRGGLVRAGRVEQG